jgi:predicted AAA+ superfamily ATPase
MLAYRLSEYGKVKHLDSGEKPVPDTNTLKELLKGKKVLTLMDEIVKYAFNLQRSAETKNYGYKVVTCFSRHSLTRRLRKHFVSFLTSQR